METPKQILTPRYRVRSYDPFDGLPSTSKTEYLSVESAERAAGESAMRYGFDGCMDIVDSRGHVVKKNVNPSIAMTRFAQKAAIEQAYLDLRRLYLADGFRDVAETLFSMNLVSERKHRGFRPDHITCGISANLAAKLFTVQHLLEGFADPNKWTVDDILSIRNEVLYAQAYAKRFHKELAPWSLEWAERILAIDYADLMTPKEQK